MEISLCPMTDEMYYEYFKEYELDPDLFFDRTKFVPYQYDKAKVAAYIARQKEKKRIPLAVMLGGKAIGEVILKDIEEERSVTLGISMQNDNYKNRGFGTEAERLAIKYAFEVLGVKTVFADALITNERSMRVLQKVGFTETGRDEKFVYYRTNK